ncbi:putative BAG family molecular chaperone regulator 1 [Iris pallida]|uniref:BAG family molecular chaperone regulator 1 n=1 Tax=Iris pallida TaxID=29817 RepID=A0AAX6HSE4_IRIPA|nr:putative BAG family molecular chaperone regulator 1 [Iris pallida]
MMRASTRSPAESLRTLAEDSAGAGTRKEEWEVRPCGMLVQKRNPDSEPAAPPPPVFRLRVKYGSSIHEIYISSQATFGELKKMLSGPTGLHHEDQKILFKDKERQSRAFLDTCGVKDRSKLLVVEDEVARAKRCLDARRAVQAEKAAKSIAQIGRQVDKLASKVSAVEAIVSKGKKVAENDVLNLIEMLMNELLKLDSITAADEDAKLQRRMQVERVQKYVESLDMVKIKNESASNGKTQPPLTTNHKPAVAAAASRQKPHNQNATPPSTTKWDMFDSLFDPPSTSAADTNPTSKPAPRLDWELF